MERKIVLASHGALAEGLLNTAEMIIGEIEYEVEVYSLLPGNLAEDYAKKLREEIIASPEKEFVILVDLYGASVFTAMYSLIPFENVKLFTGMNLNMLLSVCLEHKEVLCQEEAENVMDDAKQGVQFIKTVITENDDF